jgi:hypothetical protein
MCVELLGELLIVCTHTHHDDYWDHVRRLSYHGRGLCGLILSGPSLAWDEGSIATVSDYLQLRNAAAEP